MKIKTTLFAGVLTILLAGCSSDSVEVVDLNRVLDVMADTLDQTQAKMGSEFEGNSEDPVVRQEYMEQFNVLYAENLNAAKLMSTPVGTSVQSDGSISGFNDPNQNMTMDGSERQIFIVEIDAERNRLIATDTQNGYHRDHGFSMAGLAAGMLIGHLLSRQRAAGITGSRFSNMTMSPKNYHSSAVQSAKTSARAKAGSGSFSQGK
jgi:hypothetical protein